MEINPEVSNYRQTCNRTQFYCFVAAEIITIVTFSSFPPLSFQTLNKVSAQHLTQRPHLIYKCLQLVSSTSKLKLILSLSLKPN